LRVLVSGQETSTAYGEITTLDVDAARKIRDHIRTGKALEVVIQGNAFPSPLALWRNANGGAYVSYTSPNYVKNRIDLLYRHDFDALDRSLQADVDTSPIMRPAAIIAGKQAAQYVLQSKYAPVIAQYAMMKHAKLGDCGQPMQRFDVTTTEYTTYRNMLGTINRTEVTGQSTRSFGVEAEFAPMVKRAEAIGIHWSTAKEFAEIFKGESCQSPRLARIEANMVEYFNK